MLITLEHQHVTEVFCGFGEKEVRAETVAKDLISQVRQYVASGAAVGEHLADQIMLPFALAGGGQFATDRVSQHAITNAGVIERFLPVVLTFEKAGLIEICKIEQG